jgi:hypothetical protein
MVLKLSNSKQNYRAQLDRNSSEMTISTKKKNRIGGAIFLLFGALCILYIVYSQGLILENYSFFIVRYSKLILVSYVALGFVVFGILYFLGFLVPYYKANKYEKAKSNCFSSIFGAPLFFFLLILCFVGFRGIEIKTYRILGILFSSIMILYCLWSFVSNLNAFKKFHRKKRNV